MKKYLVGIFAVILAISATAFTKVSNFNDDVYYWYDIEGNRLNDIPSELPPNGCDEGTEICAFGHVNQTSTPGVGFQKVVMFPDEK